MKRILDELNGSFGRGIPSPQEQIRVLSFIGTNVITIPEKSIVEHDFLILFAKLSEYLEAGIPLASRILIIKILQNSSILLSDKCYNTQVGTAISIITGQFENECQKQKPSVGFLIAILDAFQIFGSKKVGDHKELIDSLTKIADAAPNLNTYKKNCIRHALDMDTVPFQGIRQFEKGLKKALEAFGSAMKGAKPRASVQLPTRQTTDNETRLQIQKTIKDIQQDEMLTLVELGLKKLVVNPSYELPENVNSMITDLMSLEKLEEEAPVDPHVNNIETSVFIITQGLDKMVSRVKFTSQKIQSEFLAMIITTVDKTVPETYLTCTGPCTETALAKSISDLNTFSEFINHWILYEYVKSPEERYFNLVKKIVIEICKHLTKNDSIDENPFLSFFRSLPTINNKIFYDLAEQIIFNPTIAPIIINNMTVVSIKYPGNQNACLNTLLELSSSPDAAIRTVSIETCITQYYEMKTSVEKMEERALENLKNGSMQTTVEEARQYLQYFFEMMKHNSSLLPELLDFYGKMSDVVQKEVRDMLQAQLSEIGFNIKAIEKCFARKTTENVKLIHFILTVLANISTIPKPLSEIIREEYNQTKDARFLIPIIPSLSEKDFYKYLPEILRLSFSAIKQAIQMYLKAIQKEGERIREKSGKKASEEAVEKLKVTLLTELHNEPLDEKIAKETPRAIQYCISEKTDFPYTVIAAAVQIAITRKPLDFICCTLDEIYNQYKDHQSFVLNNFSQLLKKDICNTPSWGRFKALIYKMIPNSFKFAYSLPEEKLKDLIVTYPDLHEMMLNDTKTKRKTTKKVIQVIQEAIPKPPE